jgi:hypothetical protein
VRFGYTPGPQTAVHNQAFNVGRTEENYRSAISCVVQIVPGSRVKYAEGGGGSSVLSVNCDKIAPTLGIRRNGPYVKASSSFI